MANVIRLSEDTVGDYFIDEAERIWRHVTYAAQPTASLECVYDPRKEATGERRGGVVGMPIFNGFARLTPAAEDAPVEGEG